MKIGGKEVTKPQEEVLILPRGDDCIVIRAQALDNMEEFEKLCPEPTPPGKLTKDGWVPDPEDKGYRSVIEVYGKKRLAYMVIATLEPSEIEWTKVDVSNPSTWLGWEQEMRDAGITQIEINRIYQLVIEANSLSEAKLQAAREVVSRRKTLSLANLSNQ
jgi:hypothetical protein